MLVEKIKALTVSGLPATGTYAVSNIELKPFKQKEGFFLSCDLFDKTGSVKGIIWEKAETIKAWLKDRMVVEVTGEIARYNDQPQFVIKAIKNTTEFDPRNFVPALDENKQEELFSYLTNTYKTINNPVCKGVWSYFVFEHPNYGGCFAKKFKTCPGGVGAVHHNYIGGLLEHSCAMMKVAEHLCTVSPLDRDILLTGCLIHDVGKIKAYTWDIVIEMNDTGRLLHHVPLGFGMITKLTTELGLGLAEDDVTLLKLLHILVSHHEEEGHRLPMFPEAMAISEIDALDAMINHSLTYIENNQESGKHWTKFCNLTERQYYNIKKEEPPVVPETGKKKIIIDNIF